MTVNTIRIGIAQVPQTDNIGTNLGKVLEYIEKAGGQGVEFLCFPETHLAGYRAGILAPGAPCDADALKHATDTVRAHCAQYTVGVIVGTETPKPGGKPPGAMFSQLTTGFGASATCSPSTPPPLPPSYRAGCSSPGTR